MSKPAPHSQVVVNRNILKEQLLKGDVATVIEYIDHPHAGEEHAILEVFNAVGKSLRVVSVPVSAIEALSAEYVPTVRKVSDSDRYAKLYMTPESFKTTVRDVVAGYAKNGLNSVAYLTQNEDGTVYIVADTHTSQGKRSADTSVFVRIVDEYVIIEIDHNDKIVLDALVQAGIPRQQIILAYAGEPIPEAAGS